MDVLNPNVDMQKIISKSGVKKWQIAVYLKIGDTTLQNWLHRPLTSSRREKILHAVNAIKQAKKAGE